MNLKIIKWIIPIILELFKKDKRYPGYFKRSKSIAMLFFACLLSLLLALFMFEQAMLHGTNSEINSKAAKKLSTRLQDCEIEKKGILNSCGSVK